MKRKIKKSLLVFVTVVTGFLLISERESVIEAVSRGLSLCGDVLIPSLFPFMVLSSFCVSLGIFEEDSQFSSFLMKKIFHLPAVCFSAILFGFTGGYPVGAKIISRLYEDGRIESRDARHLFSFCINAGPAFAVSVAGSMLTGDKRVGYVILSAVCVSSLMTGVIYGAVKRHDEQSVTGVPRTQKALSESLLSAVNTSLESMLSVCGWMLVFSAASVIIRGFIVNEKFALLYDALSEVTSGLESAARLGSVEFVAASISFGGICVMFQLMPYIKKCGMKISEYLLFRIVNSVLTYVVCRVLLNMFNISVSVYSDLKPTIHFAPASAMLLMMCAVMIADFSRFRKHPC